MLFQFRFDMLPDYHLLKSVIVFIVLFVIYGVHCSAQPEVRTPQGLLKGRYLTAVNNRQIASFEGIPYAKPPTGKHRFKAPVAAGMWYGVLNATREPPHCLQYNFFASPPYLSGSEDCLYVNVYTPQFLGLGQQKPLDVLVFIHGGAFMVGQSTTYGPSILLQRDLVLVTFNYRLGPLGFLSTEDNVVPGNNGLKDQVIALKWVQQNIAAFGGNPNSVTIGGFSAGAASCHFHMLSPLSKGLFKGAILMSGLAVSPWSLVENPLEKAQLLANELGCPTNDSLQMIKCLRNRPADHIVGSAQKLLYWTSNPMVPLGPVIEPIGLDAFISEPPIDIIKNKNAADVPTIISFTADEGLVSAAAIIINSEMYNEVLDRWDELLPHILDFNYTAPKNQMSVISQQIKEFYKIDNTTEGRKNYVKLIGDRLAGGSDRVFKLASIYNSPMYLYRFSYSGTNSFTDVYTTEKLGVNHGDDIFYTLGYKKPGLKPLDENDLQLSEQMLDVFVSFAANGTLGENWQSISEQLPKIVMTDIKGPNKFQLTVEDEPPSVAFWDSLGLMENIVSPIVANEEL